MFQPKITSYEDVRLQKEPMENSDCDGEVNKGVIGSEAIDNTQPNVATFTTKAYFLVLITPCQANLATVANRWWKLDNLVIYMIHRAGRSGWRGIGRRGFLCLLMRGILKSPTRPSTQLSKNI